MDRRKVVSGLALSLTGGLGAAALLRAGRWERAAAMDTAHGRAGFDARDQQSACGLRSIESFGAIGDGQADDTQAFFAAVEWERTTPGRRYVALTPARIYRVSETLRFDFDHGGLVCLAGATTIEFDMDEGNGIEIIGPTERRHVSGSWFRGVHLVSRTAREGHAWYYRRARYLHINENCGASGGWNHSFHYDNSCFGNNVLVRPHLELAGRGRVGVWIGPVCNGLHVLHAEINNPAEIGIEIDASAKSDLGEGPGVNSVVLDHILTHACGTAHIRMNGALSTSIRNARLEAGNSSAPLVVIGDRRVCEGLIFESGWFQGSGSAPVAFDLHAGRGLCLLGPQFYNLTRAAVVLRRPDAVNGGLLIHPRLAGTPELFEAAVAGEFMVVGENGDVALLGGGGLVLTDVADGSLHRLGLRSGRIVSVPVEPREIWS